MSSNVNLIALHGWAMGPAVFEPTDWLPADLSHLISPALPGYPSSHWSAKQSLQRQVEAMAADLPSGHLLGWSLGGLYALQLFRQFPEQFSGLTLVCFNPCFVAREDWSCGIGTDVFERFANDLQRGWRATLQRFLTLQLHGQTDARSQVRELMTKLAEAGMPDDNVLLEGLQLLKQSDCRESLFSDKQPLQMIFAENDPLVPATCAQQISQIAPTIQVECIAGASHLPFLTHADQFRQSLITAIQQH